MEILDSVYVFERISTVIFTPGSLIQEGGIIGFPGTTRDYCEYVLNITDEMKCNMLI